MGWRPKSGKWGIWLENRSVVDCGERIVGVGVEAWEGEGERGGDVSEERSVERRSAGMGTRRRRG